MKYTANNQPLVCMMTQSTCYKGTEPMVIKGVLWHSTGANNTSLKRYVQPSDDDINREELLKLLGVNRYKNDWNHIERQAGLNAWIGKLADGTVATVQTMPWNFRPWGCGSGIKGSCNNGWIQFEICEDGLNNKEYFDLVYQEACELTAYLCELYNIDPLGVITMNGVTVPTILCHKDANTLGLGSNHGDILHWFPKYNKNMETVRQDVLKLMQPATQELYRVRTEWTDKKSQIGSYAVLENAKKACDAAGKDYKVYDSKGNLIYPTSEDEIIPVFEVGDAVRLVPGAKYASGSTIPAWVQKAKLYIRQIKTNGDYIISIHKTGAITGTVHPIDVVAYESTEVAPNFTPYLARVTANLINVRNGPGMKYKINTTVRKHEIYTIIAEQNGYGKLKSGAGWVSLTYIKKV